MILWTQSMATLRRMYDEGVEVDLIALSTGTAACARSTCWRHAALILGRIVDDMKPDLTAFNIDISGCRLQWLQGFSRLSRLKQIGLGPTAVTYGEILKACLKSEEDRSSWQRAWRLFDGASLDLVARSIAAGGASWHDALALLGDTATRALRGDTVLLNGALGSCAAAKRWCSAIAVLRSVAMLSLRASAVTYSTATAAAGRCHLWEMAFQATQELRSNALEASLVAQSAATGACIGRWRRAIHLALDLQSQGVRGNAVMFGAVLAACDEGEKWSRGLSFLIELDSRALLLNTMAMNSLISAVAVGAWSRAFRFFEVAHGQLQLDIISWGSLIGSQSWQRAMQLVEGAKEASVRLSLEAINAALSAFQAASSWRGASAFFWHFNGLLLEPDSVSELSAISSMGNAGRWQGAAENLQRMRRRFTQLDVITFSASISSCARARTWRAALQLLRTVELHGVRPNEATVGAVISACEGRKRRS